MNKKGMTLIELMAVIAIIAILSIMITPNIIQMRKDSISSNVDNKIQRIRNAAISYAEDNLSSVPNEFTDTTLNYNGNNNTACLEQKTFDDTYAYCEKYCLIVYIGTLVDQGYLAGDNDDKTQIIHPFTGESLNFRRVCVRYDSNVVVKPSTSTDDTRKLVAYIVDEGQMYEGLK